MARCNKRSRGEDQRDQEYERGPSVRPVHKKAPPQPDPERLVLLLCCSLLLLCRGLASPPQGSDSKAVGVHAECYGDRDESDMKHRPRPVMPREVTDPEGNKRERHNPPREGDRDYVLQTGKGAFMELQPCEVLPHETVQKPGVGFLVESLTVRGIWRAARPSRAKAVAGRGAGRSRRRAGSVARPSRIQPAGSRY